MKIIKNIEEFRKNNIMIDENDIEIYCMYHSLVTKYMSKKMNLRKYDEEFLNSDLNYINIDEKNMDLFQYLSSSDLKYLYLRNIIHIERLSEEEKNYLRYRVVNNLEELDETVITFIEDTMSKCLSYDVSGEEVDIFYGPLTNKFEASSKDLIIGFRYDEYNKSNMSDEEWYNLYKKQDMDIFSKLNSLDCDLRDGFALMPVTIIQYNNFCVKQIDNKEKTL